jgi:hypothetical protein
MQYSHNKRETAGLEKANAPRHQTFNQRGRHLVTQITASDQKVHTTLTRMDTVTHNGTGAVGTHQVLQDTRESYQV